ncbi:MAG: hypothetical protein ABSH39_18085 [Candidatus Acidiferrum sp.]|jgi:hypothetical protein
MKLRCKPNLLTAGVLAVFVLAVPFFVRAQAPPGPLPAAKPQDAPPKTVEQPKAETRTSILGRWKLNRDDSDDAHKKLQDAQNNASSRRGGSGISIAGFPVGGRGGGRSGQSDADQQRLQDVVAPANSLTLAQKDAKDPEVDLTDDQNRKLVLFTDGRKIEKADSKDDSYQEIAAHWDGARLATDEKGPRGGKMSRTFELSYDGTQLYETLHLVTGRSNTPVDVRYVYDPAPPVGERPNS